MARSQWHEQERYGPRLNDLDFRFAGAHAYSARCRHYANGTGAAADPAIIRPCWLGAEDTLWIAVAGSGETAIAGSWTGTGTTDLRIMAVLLDTPWADTSTIGQVDLAFAFRQVNASAENVGTFSAIDISECT